MLWKPWAQIFLPLQQPPCRFGSVQKNGKFLGWRCGSAWSRCTQLYDKTPFGFDGKIIPSFDQIGFVWSATNGDSNVKLNFGFKFIIRARISLRFFLLPIISRMFLKPNGLLPRRLTLKNWTIGCQSWFGYLEGNANYNALMGVLRWWFTNQMTYDGRSFLWPVSAWAILAPMISTLVARFNDRFGWASPWAFMMFILTQQFCFIQKNYDG